MFLPDTNVFSELKKIPRGLAEPSVVRWFAQTPVSEVWLSVIVGFEITKGMLLKQRHDPAQAAELLRWYEFDVLPRFDRRILPVTLEIAERCAALQVPDPRAVPDSLLAATALVHNLTVVTRNVKHFQGTGVAILNPWT
jgi:predicted nucleic acid-binding protein